MRVRGGPNIFGFSVGILMLDTRFPRIAGDMGNAGTFDFPVLGVGVCVHMDGELVTQARIRLGGAGSYAIPCVPSEELLRGKRLTKELCAEAGRLAQKPSKPMDNTDFEAGWRKKMVPVFVARTLMDCAPA